LFQIDIPIDGDRSGDYNYPTDPSWRLIATSAATALHPTFPSA
jgi:hypothetical protein